MRGQQLTTITDHYILFLTTNVSHAEKKCKDDCDVLYKQQTVCILDYLYFSITCVPSPLIRMDIKKILLYLHLLQSLWLFSTSAIQHRI